ncbi:MAG: hypothetical protein HC808_04880 [Candidatus Competibacteraceae bacterium]|nr:hypothetical protein [Candidatus Competibacteraceae bacterium]
MNLSNHGMTIPAVLGAVTTVVVTGLALLIEPALADNAGEIGEHLASQGEGLGKAISTGCYVGGMAAGGGGFPEIEGEPG